MFLFFFHIFSGRRDLDRNDDVQSESADNFYGDSQHYVRRNYPKQNWFSSVEKVYRTKNHNLQKSVDDTSNFERTESLKVMLHLVWIAHSNEAVESQEKRQQDVEGED